MTMVSGFDCEVVAKTGILAFQRELISKGK